MKKINVAGALICLIIFTFFVLLFMVKDATAANPEQLIVTYRMRDSSIRCTIIKDVKTNKRYLVVYTENGLAITKMDG